MAAVTTAAIAGAGALMSFYGAQQQAAASRRAGELNARELEANARLAAEKAAEDERQFRLSFRREEGRNVASVGASGIKMEGSVLEVMQDNAAMAERDALNIRRYGELQRDTFLRQARNSREMGQAQGRAAEIQGAANLLSGAADTYTTGRKSGAW